MVIVKLNNCTIGKRSMQNRTIWFCKEDFGIDKSTIITEDFILSNGSISGVSFSKNTKVSYIEDSDFPTDPKSKATIRDQKINTILYS